MGRGLICGCGARGSWWNCCKAVIANMIKSYRMNGQTTSEQILRMKYNPAKKKVLFELFRNQKIEIPDTNRLA